MATLNSFIRSANASYKRAARANERYVREQAKRHQQNLKEQLRNENISAVKSYNEFVEMLVSIHKDCSQKVIWKEFLQDKEPVAPIEKKHREQIAIFASNKYKASFFDKILNLEKGKRKRLILAIEKAAKDDGIEYQKAKNQHDEDLEDWKTIQSITIGVLANDTLAYKSAIEFFNPFTNISQLGTKLDFSFNEQPVANVFVNSNGVVPDYVLSYTAGGKLSNKKMSISNFNELYQDYICSCAIRVARESFALLPITFIYINVISDLLDSSTGMILPRPILSCKFLIENMDRLCFENIDCSEAMKNFVHRMKFHKINGFLPIETLKD